MVAVTQATLDSATSTYLVNGDTERVIIWSSTGAYTCEFTEGGEVQRAIIGAGGAAGPITFGSSGGSSGGDVLLGTATVTAQAYALSVGAKGAQTSSSATSGGNTSAFGLTALGGGHGGYFNGAAYVEPVQGGGAGQRGAGDSRLGAAHPTSFEGGDAFRGPSSPFTKNGGGGRGAGGNGGDGSAIAAGVGGQGASSVITGWTETYGVGGKGGESIAPYVNAPGVSGTTPGSGASGASIDITPAQLGADGVDGAIILRFAVASGPDPIVGTGIRQPAPQVPIATLTAATTILPIGIRQAAPIIPQGAVTVSTTFDLTGIRQPAPQIPQANVGSAVSLSPVGIRQPAPQVPRGTLTASTMLAPVGIRQPAPVIPEVNVGSSISLTPTGIRQPAPRVPQVAVTVATAIGPVGIRQPAPIVPQVAVTTAALGLTGIRQPAPRVPRIALTTATVMLPTGIRQPGPRVPRLKMTEPVVAIGAVIYATAIRGPKIMEAEARRGPKIMEAEARRDR